MRDNIWVINSERKLNMAEKPIVTITMENGDVIKAELYPDIAPQSVNNFISLINKGFYNGLIFHRVINGFENNLKHTEGVLSMARAYDPNSGGSQFFIMHKTSPHLDGQYAAFGKVIEGMDVVNKIAECATNPFNDRPLKPQVMQTVTVETFGVDYPEPEKM